MVKLVDTLDSKSSDLTVVPVRFRLSVPKNGVGGVVFENTWLGKEQFFFAVPFFLGVTRTEI